MKKTYLISFFLAVVFFAPNAAIQADDSSFLERIDYSNVDIIGLAKTKGKGDYKVRTVQPISIDENSGDTVFMQGLIEKENFRLLHL